MSPKNYKLIYHIIILAAIAPLLYAPGFSLAQNASKSIEAPGTTQDFISLAVRILKALPGALRGVFADAFRLIGRMIEWLWKQIDFYMWPKFGGFFGNISGLADKKIEKIIPALKKELIKEKQEIQQEFQQQAQDAGKSFWERLKTIKH